MKCIRSIGDYEPMRGGWVMPEIRGMKELAARRVSRVLDNLRREIKAKAVAAARPSSSSTSAPAPTVQPRTPPSSSRVAADAITIAKYEEQLKAMCRANHSAFQLSLIPFISF